MKISKCKHCEKEFDITTHKKGWMANHSRWCTDNPKSIEYKKLGGEKAAIMREAKAISGYHNGPAKAKILGIEWKISEATRTKLRNANLGKKLSEKTKEKLRQKALASNHRRLNRKIINYKGVMLDSTWELALAERLDQLNVKWIRPNPIPWIDNKGIKHNYFPDFYLSDYNLYLDPKNPECVRQQKEKLDILKETYDNIVIIDSLEKCKLFKPV